MSAQAIDLLLQLREANPVDALQQLGILLSPCEGGPLEDAVGGTQKHLVHFLCMAHSESSANQKILYDVMGPDLARVLLLERGPMRKRCVFLVTVLSADARSAAALSNSGVVQALCAMLDKCQDNGEGEKLSEAERHWILIALAAFGAHPCSRDCVRQHALGQLCDILEAVAAHLKAAPPAALPAAVAAATAPARTGSVPGSGPNEPPKQLLARSLLPGAAGVEPLAMKVTGSLSLMSSSSRAAGGETKETASLVGMGYAAGGRLRSSRLAPKALPLGGASFDVVNDFHVGCADCFTALAGPL